MLSAHDLSKTYESPTREISDILVMWLVLQSLPRIKVPKFNSNPMKSVEFVIKFKEPVQDQVYVTVMFIFLIQHVEGEATRVIQVFSTNKNGYILALKRLKYMFGQKPLISPADISKLTTGKPISNDDGKSLLQNYYTMTDCVVTFKKLNYVYDLYSTDVLGQTIDGKNIVSKPEDTRNHQWQV